MISYVSYVHIGELVTKTGQVVEPEGPVKQKRCHISVFPLCTWN